MGPIGSGRALRFQNQVELGQVDPQAQNSGQIWVELVGWVQSATAKDVYAL